MDKWKLADRWKKIRKDQLLIGVLTGVLLLVIALPSGQEKREPKEEKETEQEIPSPWQESKTSQLEGQLKAVLEQVAGVGRVQVMVTAKSYGKKTVEKDLTQSEENSVGEHAQNRKQTEETTVYERDSQGNERPFVTEETAPVIQGVLVAAQGGDNLTVAEDITEAAMVLFGVEAHKIKVMKLN